MLRHEVLPRAWRGSVGVLASNGAIYGSGLFFAQVGDSTEVAGYLFALSVMGIVRTLAVSPYAARMPELARLWAKGEQEDQNRLAADGIVLSMGWFAMLALLVPGTLWIANRVLTTDLLFVDASTWLVMVAANALLCYGALHMQYYTVTNDVRWHIVDTVNGVLFISVLTLLFNGSVLAFPLSQGIALLLFYLPYARYLTMRRFAFSLAQDVPRSSPLILGTTALLGAAAHFQLY